MLQGIEKNSLLVLQGIGKNSLLVATRDLENSLLAHVDWMRRQELLKERIGADIRPTPGRQPDLFLGCKYKGVSFSNDFLKYT